MKCINLNTPSVILVLFSLFLNNVDRISMADNHNHMDLSSKDQAKKNSSFANSDPIITPKSSGVDSVLQCASDTSCNSLDPPCIECDYDVNCTYGKSVMVTCRVNPVVKCEGERRFQRLMICRYCYQTDPWDHSCELKANCNSASTPRAHYKTNCTVSSSILCLGHRTFNKNIRCNWTGGYRWSVTLILSITLGGFGADRFYLGHWQEGIGKLFSFGGLGVWTLIDVILISLHYLGPADGSLYI